MVEAAAAGTYLDFLGNAAGGTPVILFLVLAGLLSAYADFKTVPGKIAAGSTHALVHAVVAAGVVYLIAKHLLFTHSAVAEPGRRDESTAPVVEGRPRIR